MEHDYMAPENVEVKMFSKKFIQDPFETYRILQEKAPILSIPGLAGKEWIISKHDDVVSVLKSKLFVKVDVVHEIKQKAIILRSERNLVNLATLMENWLFFMEGPRHQTLRRLVVGWFTQSRVSALSYAIDQIILDEMARLCDRPSFDVLDDLSVKVIFKLMCKFLGCEWMLSEEAERHASEIFRIVNPPIPLKAYEALDASAGYLIKKIGDGLRNEQKAESFSCALRSSVNNEEITKIEAIGLISMLLSVGLDTTKHLIGNSLHALSKEEHQRNYAKESPEKLKTAILECARYNSPVSILPRTAKYDSTIGGARIKAGERLYLLLGSACRDSERFHRSDELDVHRRSKTSLMFGAGIHFCLGSHIAQVIGTSIVSSILNNRSLLLDFHQASWINSPGVRGLTKITARWV